MDIKNLLDLNLIGYESFMHQPVFTCEEAADLLMRLPGTPTKNLLLRDKKGRRFFLVLVPAQKQVDLIALGNNLGVGRLGFCSPDRLQELLKIPQGSVSPLALINDESHRVELVIDEMLWQQDNFHCHPLVNTETLIISKAGLSKFFEITGHIPQTIKIN